MAELTHWEQDGQVFPDLNDAILEDVANQEAQAQESPTMDRLMDLVAELDQALVTKAELESHAKEIGKRADELSKRIIPDLMDQLGVRSLNTDFGKRLGQRTDTYVNVRAADKPALLEWLRDNGHASLIKEDVHSGTLKAFIKDLLDQGIQIPEFVSTYTETKATLTKSR